MRSPARTAKVSRIAVHGPGVADAPGVARVHEAHEIVRDARLPVEPPVGEHPHQVAIHGRRVALLDDQRAVKPAPDLLRAAEVRVVPVGARVRQLELVGEAAAVRRDRRLRHVRHAVHRVGEPDAVEVHRGVRGKRVLDLDAQALPLPEAQLGAGHGSVVGPHRRLRIRRADERLACKRDAQSAPRRLRPSKTRCDRKPRTRGEKLPPIHGIFSSVTSR